MDRLNSTCYTHSLYFRSIEMHNLTSVTPRPVRFRAWLWNGTEYTFQFDTFQVLDKSTDYTLKLDNFNGTGSSAGSFQRSCKLNLMYNANTKFTTIDRDNDV